MKIKKHIKQFFVFVKKCCNTHLHDLDFVAKCLILEMEIDDLSFNGFCSCVGKEAMALSKKTGIDYFDYLEQIKNALDDGKTENEILWYFQSQLY